MWQGSCGRLEAWFGSDSPLVCCHHHVTTLHLDGKSITLALSEITPMSWPWRGLTWCDSRRSDEDCLVLTRYHWFYTTSGSSGRGTDGTEPTSGWRTSWRTFRPRLWAQGCSAGKPAAQKSLTLQQIMVTKASYFALLDQLSLGGKIDGAVDHLPDPHHSVGVRGSRQHRLQGEGKLEGGFGQAQLPARLGDWAEEHVVAGEPLDGLDQHCVHPELEAVGELVWREELEVVVHDDGAPAVVDAVSPVLPRQADLLPLKQLPTTSCHD